MSGEFVSKYALQTPADNIIKTDAPIKSLFFLGFNLKPK